MTTTENPRPLSYDQEHVRARYKRWAGVEQDEKRLTGRSRDKRAAIARALLSRDGARPLMPDDAPDHVVEQHLTEHYPEQAPGVDDVTEMALAAAGNVAAIAFNLAVETQQLAECLYFLGRGDVAAGMLDDDGVSRLDQPALAMLVRFYRLVGIPLEDESGSVDPDLQRAADAVDAEEARA